MSKWIKIEDKVFVRAGNDKGRVGKVLARKGSRVVVQGVNIRKKHMRRRSQEQGGEIIEIERPIHISNVAFCGKNDTPVRVRVKRREDGAKDLYYLDGEKEIILRSTKSK